ncbi:hypothetical protein LUZ61_009427 [Rhynchospora tenuis]|uniref:Rx N-terminal domain-containing protein n=1 Tax=Rhynchospora tenuis TaxID=198213 RepID=A0AAD5ZX73_9POAL|nr:hypothetical protein LUZ61_009427 [Rhynchospora tenuis]
MTGIELLVGGWFASPVIRSVLEKAQKYVRGNYKLNKNTEELIETLTRKLALCQETVKVAERRMIKSEHLIVWLNMVKKAVYDAEDVLDDMEAKSIEDQVEGKNKISGIGQLVNLQELDEYRVGETEGHKITELNKLTELSGHLTIMNCDNIRSKDEAKEARLADKENLNSVELRWSRESNMDQEILEGLKPYKELSIQGDLQLLTNLKRLEIRKCPQLMSNSMHDITNKQKGKNLEVNQAKGSEQREFTMDQILWFQELTSLQELTFSNCKFTQLPSSLVTLPSLRKVKFNSCSDLQSLPENGMSPLWELALDKCSQNLMQRCQPGGEDWPLIAHVPVILIDGKVIRRPQSSTLIARKGPATFRRKFWRLI